MRPLLRRVPGWLAVYVGFLLVHGLLTMGTWDVIDQEELEFGTVPLILLDGEPDAIGANRTIRREGSQVLLAPFFVLVFALFGTSMAALKFGGLLVTGVWAAGWFTVARRALPHVSPWLVGAAFVLPVPLVQRSAVSAASIHTHLGASMLHALVILLVLWAMDRKWWWLALSGAMAGVGVFFSLTLGPLLIGVAWLVWKAGGIRGLLAWGLAAVPGTLWQLRGIGGVAGGGDISATMKGTVVLDPSVLSIGNLVAAVKFGTGFADPGWKVDSFLRYSPWGALFVALCVGIGVVGVVRSRAQDGAEIRQALLVAALVFTPLLLLGEGSVRGDLFDGPRYTLPLLPLLTIAALHGAGRLGWLVPAAHALGFLLLFRPAVFPAPWADVRGDEPWLDRRPQRFEFVLDEAPEGRRARYALWAGMRIAADDRHLRSPQQIQDVYERQQLDGLDADEFWRGVGYSLEVWTAGVDREVGGQLMASSTPQVQARLWEGAAMAWKCANPAPLTARAGREFKTALAWGRGRVDLFCRPMNGRPIDDRGLGPAFHDGLRANWALDIASDREITATPAFLRTLRIYARFDLRDDVRARRR